MPGGATAPPKFFRSSSESPTQTIDSSPCCKTGPSSGPQMKMSGSAPDYNVLIMGDGASVKRIDDRFDFWFQKKAVF